MRNDLHLFLFIYWIFLTLFWFWPIFLMFLDFILCFWFAKFPEGAGCRKSNSELHPNWTRTPPPPGKKINANSSSISSTGVRTRILHPLQLALNSNSNCPPLHPAWHDLPNTNPNWTGTPFLPIQVEKMLFLFDSLNLNCPPLPVARPPNSN